MMHILEYFSRYWLAILLVLFFVTLISIAVAIVLKMMVMWLRSRSQRPFSLRVEDRNEVTDQLFTVKLSALLNKRLLSFYPGQYITLEIPISSGITIRRAYSIANWDKHPKYYDLGIKREENGKGSIWLYNQLKDGCSIKVHRPKGGFYLPQTGSGTLVFIAAGIGITPFRAMIQAIAKGYLNGQQYDVFLFHSCRTLEQLCYGKEFADIQKQHPSFTYIPIITGDVTGWTGERGRIRLATIQQYVPHFGSATYYLCAGIDMMEQLSADLTENGVAPSKIITESYGVSGLSQTDRRYSVVYHDQSFCFDNQATLFQAIEDAALPIDGDCRSGSCGMCKCQLAQGRVSYLIKPQHPLKNNEILPCCCVPETDLILQ